MEVENNTCTKELFEKVTNLEKSILVLQWLECHTMCSQVLGVFELTGYTFALYCKRDKSQEIISSKEKTVATYGLKHGDMVYLWSLAGSSTPSEPSGNVKNGVTTTASSSSSFGSSSSSIAGSKIPTRSNVEEDQVDVILQKMKGTVKRKRDPKKQVPFSQPF